MFHVKHPTTMAKKPAASASPSINDHITEGLRPLAVPIADLNHDTANARKHSERNLSVIRSSLNQFGQRKPIVVQREGMRVIAGNGTLEVAKALGWETIAVVFVDDDATTAAQYAIADNRSAELAEWDNQALATLLESFDAEDRDAIGFNSNELDALLAGLQPAYEPNTNPEAAGAGVSEDDLSEAADGLAGQFQGDHPAKLEVCCPDCGKVFDVQALS